MKQKKKASPKVKVERPQIRPQPGYQEKVLSNAADILISGAAAGVGKTFALLLEATRYLHVKGFGVRAFRRTSPQVTNQGGLWDTSQELFPSVGGTPRESSLEWFFPAGTRVKFGHLEHEKNKYDHQGAQYPLELFDELTHFTKGQFIYLLSRNRSTCGIRSYVRATCNPDPDSWVLELIEWWIDPVTGFPIKEREGVLRYMVADGGVFIFGDTPEEVIEKCPHLFALIDDSMDKREIIKSVSFISGSIYENKKMLSVDPSYLGNLLALPPEERAQLLEGNWKVRNDGKGIFDNSSIQDLWTNHVTPGEDRYITCDYAGQGRDLLVIYIWYGWVIQEVQILRKGRVNIAYDLLERLREKHSVPKRKTLVDQDGLGGGVIDLAIEEEGGGYIGFSGGLPAMIDPKTKTKEMYKNLKTQCAYRVGQKVNDSQVSFIQECPIYVDGEMTDIVSTGKNGQILTFRKLLGEDLRSFKRKNQDGDGKKQMIGKDEQKNILGRSPDCGDTMTMRGYFELVDVEDEEGGLTII